MPVPDRNCAGGTVVARIHPSFRTPPLSPEDIEHVRQLAFASLASEAGYLAQHAEDAWFGDGPRSAEDAETTSWHVRRSCQLLDSDGWEDDA